MKWVYLRLAIVGSNMLVNLFFLSAFQNQSFLYAAGIAAIAMIFCRPEKAVFERELTILKEDNNDLI
jgi:hypothetical protein